jgi:membrane protein YqaA with SNARE-associated domain
VSASSLWVLCLLLFVDGATFAFATTPLILQYAKHHAPWEVALAGGAASALGSCVQLLLLRWLLDTGHRWLHRFAPSQEKLAALLRENPSTSFLAILVARATPLPDAPVKILAALARYPIGLYGLAVLLGALPYYFVLALLGHAVQIPTWVLVTAGALVAAGIIVDRVRRRGRGDR